MKHIEHVEDLIFNEDNGANKTLEILQAVNNWTINSLDREITVNRKHDGVAVVFGIDMKTSLFFVSTKSAWNKTPKLAYDDNDIDNYWGKHPELCEKLKYCRKYLPQIYPWYPGNIYQADILFYDKTIDPETLSFTANTLTYSPKMSLFLRSRLRKASLGICIHSKYVGTDFRNLKLSLIKQEDINQFRHHNDVCIVSPCLNVPSYVQTSDSVQDSEFESVFELVNNSNLSNFKSNELKSAMNQYIWNNIPFEGDEILFWYYRTVKNIKHRIMSKIQTICIDEFNYKIGNTDTLCEGFVVDFDGYTVKLVNRKEFSRLNQSHSKFRAEKRVAQ